MIWFATLADTTTEYSCTVLAAIAIAMSMVSLALQIGTSEAISYTSMLLDLDKMLIDKPELWQIYDAYASASGYLKADPFALKAFAYYHLNLFYFLYQARQKRVNNIFRKDPKKKQWEREKIFVSHFIKASSLAQEIVKKSSTVDLYPADFVDFLKSFMPVDGTEVTGP